MCKTRILFLGLFSAICITGNAYSLDYNNPTIFLNNNTKAEYQLAKSTFLPDSFDDLGLSGHENTKYDHNQGDNCTGYELTTCPAHGNCLSCSFNRKLKRLVSCASGYTKSGNSCSASSCSAIGYESSIPANKICTKFTEGSLTCYKDCRTVSCSAYTLNCDTFNVANSSGKTMCPDCESANASCSPKLCKVSGCQDGFKIAGNGTTCVALDDTCPDGYFKSCDTGTTGTPEYTEKGTACYQCKPKTVEVAMPILYSDLTTAKEVISSKTPIGVVYDEAKKLAVALTDVKKVWSTSSFDVPGLTNCDQYNYVSATHKAIDDLDGKKNTSTIIQYCKSYNKSCPAAEYAYNYKTEGTNAGDWYLGATPENTNIFSNTNRSKINSTLNALSSAGATELAYGISAGYWHSTESTSANAWYTSNGGGSAGVGNVSKTTEYYVRPIINYGDVKPAGTLPILYSDFTVSTDIDTSKTPIGIVIDELRHVAMALETTPPSSWSLEAHGTIDGVFSTNDMAEALSDMSGKKNSENLAVYCFSGSTTRKHCTSLQDVLGYSTEGTEPGDWYFSSLGELSQIYQQKDAVNATLALVGYPQLADTWYWSSTRSAEGYSSDGSWYIHFNQYDGMPQRTNFATTMSKIPLIKYPTGMDLMCVQLSFNSRARFCGGIDPYQGNVGNYPYCVPTTVAGGSTTYAGTLNNGHTCWSCDTGYRVHCHTNSPSVQYCDAYENGECIACYNGTLTDGKCK